MASLVPWKKKVSKYEDENDDDELGVREPRLVHSFKDSKFIMRDEANARAMEKMKSRW